MRVLAVAVKRSSWETVADLEFGPLGATTRSEQTVIWLAAGKGLAARYIRLDVNPVTGLCTVGPYSGEGPP